MDAWELYDHAGLLMTARPMRRAIYAVTLFFSVFLLTAFIIGRDNPVMVVGGEASAGTWASGALLVCSAVVALVSAVLRGGWYFTGVSMLCAVCALDERFMFHERIKSRLLVSPFMRCHRGYALLGEMPVALVAAVALVFSFFVLRSFSSRSGRLFFAGAVALGGVSVLFDIAGVSIFWEEWCKIIAEWLLATALFLELEYVLSPHNDVSDTGTI